MTRTMIAAILLGVASLGGAVLASRRLRDKPLPLWLALGHGAIGVAGLALLLSFVADLISIAGERAMWGLVPVASAVLTAAACGGLALASFRFRERPIPTPIVALHGLVAVSGYVCLVLGILTGK